MKRARSRTTKRTNHDPSLQRINKVLAAAGLGSRRDVEELILQGRVEVDGTTVTNLATRVNPQEAKIEVDGQLLKRPKLVYYALNKPKGVLSTSSDPSGRLRVIDFVPDKHRVFSVGRLDRHSEGLMLLTNDGDLAQRLAHPSFRVQKTYFVVVAGILTQEELAKLRKGVYLAEGVARIDGARIRKTRKTCTELEIILSEGKNREIRRILARAGHKVVLLRRLAIGPLRLAELPIGAARELTASEIKALYTATEPKSVSKSKPSDAKKKDVAPVELAKVVTPIESDGFDDFGVGLDGDYQYDESQLALSDDVIEFGASTDEEMDDDFVADFDSLSSGAVLGYDEDGDEYEDQPPRPRSSKPRSVRRGPGRGRGKRDRANSDRTHTLDGRGGSKRGRVGSARGKGRRGDRASSASSNSHGLGRKRDFNKNDDRSNHGERQGRDRRERREDWSESARSETDRGKERAKFARTGSDRSGFGPSSQRPSSGRSGGQSGAGRGRAGRDGVDRGGSNSGNSSTGGNRVRRGVGVRGRGSNGRGIGGTRKRASGRPVGKPGKKRRG